MKVIAKTVCGSRKDHSEDRLIVNNLVINNNNYNEEISLNIFGICDGVGGNAGGEKASSFVTSKLSEVKDFPISKEKISELLININKELLFYASRCNLEKNMATTFSGIIYIQDSLFLVHVGNTRIYRKQGKYLKQLTLDHTVYQMLLEQGRIEDAENSNKNQIYACLGGGSEEYIQSLIVNQLDDIRTNDVFILTSDGIHEYVDIEELESILKIDNLTIDIISNIIELAKKNGSKDDCSIGVIKF